MNQEGDATDVATFEDALAGWEIFKAYDYSASREEINSFLMKRGRSPISDRTYRHYIKLRRFGYTRYLPINQLDVKTLKDPFWDKAVRNRYAMLSESVPVKVFAHLDGKEYDIEGRTVEVSASSVVCRFTDLAVVELFDKKANRSALKSERVLVSFPHSQQSQVANVETITLNVEGGSLVITFGFLTIAALESMIDKKVLPTEEIMVHFVPTTETTAFSEVSRKLYWLFQTLESSRLISDELLDTCDDDHEYVTPGTRIEYMQMHSPLELALIVGAPAALLVLLLTSEIAAAREKAKKQAPAKEQEAITVTKERWLNQVYDHIMKFLKRKPREIEQLPPRAVELFERQLVPAIRELLDEATGKLEIKSKRATKKTK